MQQLSQDFSAGIKLAAKKLYPANHVKARGSMHRCCGQYRAFPAAQVDEYPTLWAPMRRQI
jgi:hypothetical protein